jgi:hypothetical protein
LCATDDEFSLFLLGELAGPRAEEFERHVAQCRDCAGRLQSEAALDEVLFEFGEWGADASSSCESDSRPATVARRWSASLLGLMSSAAAVLLIVVQPSGFAGGLRMEAERPSSSVLERADRSAAPQMVGTQTEAPTCIDPDVSTQGLCMESTTLGVESMMTPAWSEEIQCAQDGRTGEMVCQSIMLEAP